MKKTQRKQIYLNNWLSFKGDLNIMHHESEISQLLKFVIRKPEGKCHWEVLGVDENIVFRWVSRK